MEMLTEFLWVALQGFGAVVAIVLMGSIFFVVVWAVAVVGAALRDVLRGVWWEITDAFRKR